MLSDQVRHLIAQGEDIRTEFKEAASALPETFFETACAFLNREGGTILLGVADDGTIIGVKPEAASTIKKNIATQSNNSEKLDPPFVLFPIEVQLDGRLVIAVQIQADSQIHKTRGHVYDRSQDGDFRVSDPAGIAALYNRKHLTYTEGTIYPYLRFEDLRADLFPKVRRLIASRNADHPYLLLDDRQMLSLAGLYRRDVLTGQEGYTLAAALLFGTDELLAQLVPHHRIDALVRRVNVDRYDDRLDIRTNLIEAYVQLMEFVAKHLPDPFYLEGDTRISLREKIFREVVANILVHREYLNALPTTFVIYPDRVEAENASVPHYRGAIQLTAFSPFPKNPKIAAFFLQLGRVDELGSGILNVSRYLPHYVPGAQPMFLDGPVFRTVLPLVIEPLGAVADWWVAQLSLVLSETDKEAARAVSVVPALRAYLTDREQLINKLAVIWVQAGHKLNLDKTTLPASQGTLLSPDNTRQGTSSTDPGYKPLPPRLQQFIGILFACLRPKSLTELMQALGASSRAQFRNNYTEPLIHRGLLALTLPDIPRSPNQRYRTTERGRALLGGGG